jgi:hypothetical protein
LKDAEPALESVLEVMLSLHEVKDAAHKDSWRRRGELVGIFANIARKYDRLVIAIAENESATTEGPTRHCRGSGDLLAQVPDLLS